MVAPGPPTHRPHRPGYAGYYENQHIDEDELAAPADVILVTHQHKDHLQPAAVERIRGPGTTVVATLRCAALLGEGYQRVRPGETLEIAGATVRTVDACNIPGGRSTRKHHHPGDGVGYVVTLGGTRLYHAGDTDLLPGMAALGPLDVAFMPIGGTFTMDAAEAAEAVALLRPGIAIPMHELGADPSIFADLAAPRVRVVVLRPGESFGSEWAPPNAA